MNDEEHKYLWGKRHQILQRVELSVLYHQKRERFFEAWDKLTKAIAVIGGSAALANIAGEIGIKVAAGFIAITSTAALVFGFSDRSKRHAELARNFRQLEAEIIARGERDFIEDDLKAWDAKERMIETTEPPALSALVILCQNELAIASGHSDRLVPVPWHQRLLAHFVSFSPRHT